MFPGVDLAKIANVGASCNHLWLEIVRWAACFFNHTATKANAGWRSLYQGLFERLRTWRWCRLFKQE